MSTSHPVQSDNDPSSKTTKNAFEAKISTVDRRVTLLTLSVPSTTSSRTIAPPLPGAGAETNPIAGSTSTSTSPGTSISNAPTSSSRTSRNLVNVNTKPRTSLSPSPSSAFSPFFLAPATATDSAQQSTAPVRLSRTSASAPSPSILNPNPNTDLDLDPEKQNQNNSTESVTERPAKRRRVENKHGNENGPRHHDPSEPSSQLGWSVDHDNDNGLSADFGFGNPIGDSDSRDPRSVSESVPLPDPVHVDLVGIKQGVSDSLQPREREARSYISILGDVSGSAPASPRRSGRLSSLISNTTRNANVSRKVIAIATTVRQNKLRDSKEEGEVDVKALSRGRKQRGTTRGTEDEKNDEIMDRHAKAKNEIVNSSPLSILSDLPEEEEDDIGREDFAASKNDTGQLGHEPEHDGRHRRTRVERPPTPIRALSTSGGTEYEDGGGVKVKIEQMMKARSRTGTGTMAMTMMNNAGHPAEVSVIINREIETDSKTKQEAESSSTSSSPFKPRATKKPSSKPKLKLEKPHPEPANWKRQYDLIALMREKIDAPVDTLGCDVPVFPSVASAATKHEGEIKVEGVEVEEQRTPVDPRTHRFHILISLMLSSQTKDPVTSAAVSTLHTTLLPHGGLTPEALAAADEETIAGCINKVGFWRRKTGYIHEAAKRILEGGLDDGEDEEEDLEGTGVRPEEERDERGNRRPDIPRTLGGLCKLKGVGPKMAFLALQCAWNINSGIGVDVHVHRITNRLGWHKPKTTEPEQTRLNLQSWLPTHLFKPINHVLVGFGQMVCLPVGPRCDVCLLSKEKICPSRVANVNVKNRKVVEFGFLGQEMGDVQAKVEVKFEEDTLIEPGTEGLVRMQSQTPVNSLVKKEDEVLVKVEELFSS